MTTPHSIVEQAALSLSPDGGAFFANRVKQMLAEIEDGNELTSAVLSIVSLAKRLDDAGNSAPADRLLDLACSAIDRLKTFGHESRRLAEDLTRAKTRRLKAFEGEGGTKKAPRYGARPKGSVQLHSLLPPRPRRA